MFCRKVGIAFTVVLIVLAIFSNIVFAMSIEELNPIYTEETSGFAGFGKEVLGIIRNIAVISAVVVLAFIGLKFMFGSIEQKAEYKKSLVPLAIGILVVLSATTITNIVWKFQGNIPGSSEVECQHKYSSEPTCTYSPPCVLCGEVDEPMGHMWITKNKTEQIYKCLKCGEIKNMMKN